ncbi:MAG: M23 family metallopeptidase [Leptolyngbyaceae cyanobacterium bins.349]|nr:M23 family metallopeptidase [Leptolyngbyaceae cyanobacterium bins.349]
MFTEQPAPPPAVADVQAQPTDAAVAPTPPRVAPPETLPAPTPAPAPAVPVMESKPVAPVAPAPVTHHETAKAQRRKEVEQTLLELTSKARAAQKERQQQQAATETAKYGEAGDIAAAEQVINNPSLPANVRAALQKRLQAKQAKQQSQKAIAQKNSPTPAQATANSGTTAARNPGSDNGRIYTNAPIVPLSQAQMRLRLGHLIGRNLDFAFPLSVSAPVTSMFGWRIHPISGTPRFHRGIDFGAPMGTPIVAAKTGRVVAAEAMDGYGLTVIVQHGNSQQTLYGHMSQMFVQPGQVVKKGELLGLVGSTGNSTGPHLHFEIHEMTTEGWVALDPAIAMNGAIALAQTTSSPPASRNQPYTFNLALSGVMNINAPPPVLPNVANWGNTWLANLLPTGVQPFSVTQPFAATSPFSVAQSFQEQVAPSKAVQFPLALIPSTVPELGWLSPFLADLMAELTIPLPGLDLAPLAISFNPLSALSDAPAAPAPDAVAFDPKVTLPTPTAMRVANGKPLAGLTIAEQVPGAVRLEALQPSTQLPPVQQARRDRPAQRVRPTQPLQLSDNRVPSLNRR